MKQHQAINMINRVGIKAYKTHLPTAIKQLAFNGRIKLNRIGDVWIAKSVAERKILC